jgi:hypothetical protein
MPWRSRLANTGCRDRPGTLFLLALRGRRERCAACRHFGGAAKTASTTHDAPFGLARHPRADKGVASLK